MEMASRLVLRRVGQASISALFLAGAVGAALLGAQSGQQPPTGMTPVPLALASRAVADDPETVLNTYCVPCHNQVLNTGGIAFDLLDVNNTSENPEVWERAIRKLRTRTMPPVGVPRPEDATYDTVATWLAAEIDRVWLESPNPGRSASVHRLNRTEYNNAIQDLFGLDIDVSSLVPADPTMDDGFDNVAEVLSVTTTHLERYMSAARQITRLATGLPPIAPVRYEFEVPPHLEQEEYRMSEELPLGSRGGASVPYHFPVDGEYSIRIILRGNYQDYRQGMGWPQLLDIRIDGELVERFTVGGATKARAAPATYASQHFGEPEWEYYMQHADESLEVRVPVKAGPRVVAVSFVRDAWEPVGILRSPERAAVLANDERYMWGKAAVGLVEIEGPLETTGVEETPSRGEIFICRPELSAGEDMCATQILLRMARRAYRRPVMDGDLRTLLEFFALGRQQGGSFDAGIQLALERMLVSPDFLLRVVRDPAEVVPGQTYRLGDLEVASRLSFFLWSSIPDEQLLELAERGELTDPGTLEQQVRRMLADPRATALVDDFAVQWLNLRLLEEEFEADPQVFPTFDLNLPVAFLQETKLFVASTLREDRSVIDLLNADYTYLNERLARHYGIPGIYGARFRRVTLPNLEERGGLLGHGSVLTVSSYRDRTSPVLRGKWLLNNILGAPPPPPPPEVNTTLAEGDPAERPESLRERLAQHATVPVCASCHSTIDPLGWTLENFDAIGAWRTVDEGGNPVDAAGALPSGKEVEGFAGLRALLVEESEAFASTMTEKLMAYAFGRRLEYYDQPAVRQIVRDAAANDHRWSSLILGIVKSPAFLMRTARSAD